MTYCVGLNAHLLALSDTYRSAGISSYIDQLLRHLPAADPDLRYVAYYSDPGYRPPAGMTGHRAAWNTRRPGPRILWEQTRLAGLARHLDMLHGLAFASPLIAACPTVVTVHDLSFMRFPAAFRPWNRRYLAAITRISTRRAARVIAVSKSTRQDVIDFFGVAPERVVVVPNGVTDRFCLAPAHEVAAFRARRGLPERFILFLGTLEPRKNVARLIEAYAASRAAQAGVKLVVAGAQGWYYRQIYARVAALGLSDSVIFPGFVPGDELPWWYRAAEVFAYPSLFEGFGLPVLEAMACGTPTITSTASSLPEVAGKAALLIDPADTAGLAAAMDQVLSDSATAERLRTAGPRQAAKFTWERSAKETTKVYRAVLEVRVEE